MKRVSFCPVLQEEYTYSSDEYCRSPIDHVLRRLGYKKLSYQEYKNILYELDRYKLSEMVVNSASVGNLKLSFC